MRELSPSWSLLRIIRSPYTMGEAPKPWPPLTGPRSLCQSCLPAWDRAVSWRLLGVPRQNTRDRHQLRGCWRQSCFPCGADDVGRGNRASTGSCRNGRELRRCTAGTGFFIGAQEKDVVAPNNGRSVSGGRQWGFPFELGISPFDGDGRRADAMALRTAESGPLFFGEHRRALKARSCRMKYRVM